MGLHKLNLPNSSFPLLTSIYLSFIYIDMLCSKLVLFLCLLKVLKKNFIHQQNMTLRQLKKYIWMPSHGNNKLNKKIKILSTVFWHRLRLTAKINHALKHAIIAKFIFFFKGLIYEIISIQWFTKALKRIFFIKPLKSKLFLEVNSR